MEEIACSARDPCPQRSVSSNPPQNDAGIIARESLQGVRFHTGRVKTGKAHYEHMFSALLLKADITLRTRYVRFVPTPEVVFLRSLRWHGRARGRTPAIPVNPNNRRLDARRISYGPTRDLLFQTCIAEAIDLYPGKSRGQRDKRAGLEL